MHAIARALVETLRGQARILLNPKRCQSSHVTNSIARKWYRQMDRSTQPAREHILGLPVDAVSRDEALSLVRTHAEGHSPLFRIVAANPEKVYHLRSNPALMEFYRDAELVVPDGIGIVAALRLLRRRRISRLPGADLMLDICAQAADLGHPIFLYGATSESNSGAAASLLKAYPSLQIAGRSHGYHDEQEDREVVTRINASGARILFVAKGSPAQEAWVRKWHASLSHVRVVQCVGGTFDVLAGSVKRAPAIWQKVGLEWLYRLVRQPTRIRRQLLLGRFAAEVARSWPSRAQL